MSLYSPKPSASSQAATSSELHLSANREKNHSAGLLGPVEAVGCSRAGSTAPAPEPLLQQAPRRQPAQAAQVSPLLGSLMEHLSCTPSTRPPAVDKGLNQSSELYQSPFLPLIEELWGWGAVFVRSQKKL